MRLLMSSIVLFSMTFAGVGCGDDHDHDDDDHEHETGLIPGADDESAQAACGAFNSAVAPTYVPLGATPGTVSIDTGITYFRLEAATGRTVTATIPQHTTLAMFTDRDDLTLKFETDDGTVYNLAPTTLNGSCPDEMLPDFRMHIHTVGPHTIAIPDDATGNIGIFLYPAEVGH